MTGTTPPFDEHNETKPCEKDRFGYCEEDEDEDIENATEVKTCVLSGDPHITTFDSPDGKRNQNFYGYGDYWVVKSRLVGIQARYWSTRKDGKSSTRELAIIDPGSDNVILIKPQELAEEKGTPAVTYNGQPLDPDVEDAWLTYSELSTDDFADVKANQNGKQAKQAKPNTNVKGHTFLIHATSEEKGEVKVEVHQFKQQLNVIVTMWDVGIINGHCGNFDGDATNEEDQSEWLQMIDPSLVAFDETVDWAVIDAPSLKECDAAIKTAAVGACQKGLSSTADMQDIEDCVVDWCNDPDAGQKMIEAEFFTNKAKKRANKEAKALQQLLKKLKCMKGWNQLGDLSSDNSMAMPYSTQEKESVWKCGVACRNSDECMAYSYTLDKVCSFHGSISTTQSVDNQVLCERTLTNVAAKQGKTSKQGKQN